MLKLIKLLFLNQLWIKFSIEKSILEERPLAQGSNIRVEAEADLKNCLDYKNLLR